MTLGIPYAEVIGDPIGHSRSPLIHHFWLEKLGVEANYLRHHILHSELADYFTQRRGDRAWRGCNVTLPHKERVLASADIIDGKAQAVGASNCLYRNSAGLLVATNTDIDGVAASIEGIDLEGARVCVLGAGGAARAAFHALQDRHCELLVLARDPDKAIGVVREAGNDGVGVPLKAGNNALVEANLFINATQLGMDGQEPMPSFILDALGDMADGATVFDMVTSPIETELLRAARAGGLRAVDGLQMLVAQAASAFELFFDRPAPRQHDAELRALLTA